MVSAAFQSKSFERLTKLIAINLARFFEKGGNNTDTKWRAPALVGGCMLILAGLLPGVKRDSGSLFASRRLDSGAAYAVSTGRSMDLFGMAYATDRRHCHWSGGEVRSRDPPCASPLGGDRLGRCALGDRFCRLPCFDGSERGASALPVLGLVEARSSR